MLLNGCNRVNAFFEQLNVTNPQGNGFHMEGGETNVEVLECTARECGTHGMSVGGGASVVATRCEFMQSCFGWSGVYASNPNTKVRLNACTMHHNYNGLSAREHAVVDLYGNNTDIHSNTRYGIIAYSHGKVQIHLLSQHNTSHDNTRQDRHAFNDGTITNVK